MLSKNELKYYSSLLKKKNRQEEKKFLAEGKKVVNEGLKSNYVCEILIVTNDFYESEQSFIKKIESNLRIESVTNLEFHKLKDTVSPQGIAAVFAEPKDEKNKIQNLDEEIICCLDEISDPGNLGTIMRNCDWFGISKILLTENCAEIYNPKVVRASMGSLFHLQCFNKIKLADIEKLKSKGYKLLCADLNGENLFEYEKNNKNIIVFSNEANGPSAEILNISDTKLTIPSYGKAESLNVASASAVILSQLVRKY